MRGIWQRCLAVLLVFCLAWAFSGGSQATAAVVIPDVTDEITSLATKAQPYMQRNKDGTFTLTASAEELGVSKAAVDRFTGALNAVNEGVRAGYLTTDAQGQVQLTDSGKQQLGQGDGSPRVQACSQHARRLTVTQTTQLEGLLNQYSAGTVGILSIITLLALIVGSAGGILLATALALAIVGAGAYFFASWMQAVDQGNGVTLNWTQCSNIFEPIPRVWPTPN